VKTVRPRAQPSRIFTPRSGGGGPSLGLCSGRPCGGPCGGRCEDSRLYCFSTSVAVDEFGDE
jgi:hypothetical protein